MNARIVIFLVMFVLAIMYVILPLLAVTGSAVQSIINVLGG